jgi:GNAT superfamily N-acetyltransferase
MNLLPWMRPEHLAPGDTKSLQGDWSGLELHTIRSTEDPFFETAFGALWKEFGAAGEMEQASVIAERMKWHPSQILDGAALLYAMQLITLDGEFVAVRDHTAILLENEPGAIVHLSHNLVAPAWRRSGIAGWLRALPVSTALEALAAAGRSIDAPVTLVGEMEHFNPSHAATGIRLTAYEKAGYKMVDPELVDYWQPDFRDPQVIDQENGPKPIPLCLMLRRIGREHEEFVSSAEVRQSVNALYKMYGRGFRKRDMQVVFETLKNYPPPHTRIPLVPPTSVQRSHPDEGRLASKQVAS